MTPWIRRGAVVAGAVGLTLLVTWPLARCLDRCIGPPPDTLLSTYFLAWVARALTTPGVALLDAPMFAPYAHTLALGEYLPAYAPVAIPVIALTGNPVAAHGVVLLVLYVMTALGVYTLARHLLGAEGPAALAAIGFTFSPRLLDQSYNLQALAIAWVPWLFLALERFVDGPSLPRALLLLPLGLGLALSSMNIFVFTGLALMAWFAVATLQRRVAPGHLARLVAMGALGAGLLWAYLTPYRRAAQEWGLARSLRDVEQGATTLAHLLRPPPESLLRWALSGDGASSLPVEGVVLAVTVGGLAIFGLAGLWSGPQPGNRALGPYLAVAGVSLVLALGPTLHVGGHAYPMPYRALYAGVPGFDAVRTTGRFLLFVDFVVALLAGAGALRLLAQASRARQAMALAGLSLLILVESVLVPFPGAVPRLDPAALPEVYRWLRAAPPGTVALGVPMGDWANVAASALHLRRTVNGWSSFEPPLYRDLVAAMESFPDVRTLALVRGVGATVVLIDRAWLTPARAARLAESTSGLRPDRVFSTHVVYRVDGPRAPGPEGLRVEARITGERPCAVLRNPGPDWVSLYPARRLTLVGSGSRAVGPSSATWLPLDMAPGTERVACIAPGPVNELRGTIEGSGRRYEFAVRPGQPEAEVNGGR